MLDILHQKIIEEYPNDSKALKLALPEDHQTRIRNQLSKYL